VDHASATGTRARRLSTMPPRPFTTQSAISPATACSGLAPTAISPCSTTAKEEATPTNPASSPAETARADRSDQGETTTQGRSVTRDR
jgi:hypothetical protein